MTEHETPTTVDDLDRRIADAVYARMSESDGRPATTAAAIVADLRAMVGPAVAEKQDRINELEARIEGLGSDPVAEHEAEYLRAEAMAEHMHDFKHEDDE